MSSKIDLHLHSNFSDGRQTPAEVFALAAKNGVKVLSLTDHDSSRNVTVAQEEAKKQGLTLIQGTEVTTSLNGHVLHILAYKYDPQHSGLRDLFNHLSDCRKQAVVKKVESINERLITEGRESLQIDIAEFIELQNGFFNQWKLLDLLLERKIVQNRTEGLTYVKGTKISTEEVTPEMAIDLIHKAGGLAVFAHSFGPKISLKLIDQDFEAQKKIIKDLTDKGLDGLECYQPSHYPEDIIKSLTIAKEFGLTVTGGSDWHGPLEVVGEGIKEYIPFYANHPGDLQIPEEAQTQMIKLFTK